MRKLNYIQRIEFIVLSNAIGIYKKNVKIIVALAKYKFQ